MPISVRDNKIIDERETQKKQRQIRMRGTEAIVKG